MKRSSTIKFLSMLLMVFFMIGMVQAQFTTTISGTVTAGPDSAVVPGYKMLITFKDDTVGFKLPVVTNENGFYYQEVFMQRTYTLSSLDSFYYEPFSADIQVGSDPVTFNIHLNKRADLQQVNGTITFKGQGVATSIYFLKLSDDVDLNDFRDYESHFVIPPTLLGWASYSTESGADGSFNLEMLNGKYVAYVPKSDSTLTYWGVLEVNGPTTMDPVILKEMKTLSGHVANADQYDNVVLFAYSMNAGRPAMATPDENGDYTMEVAPGKYIVRCQAFFDNHMYHMFYDSVYLPKDATVIDVQDDVTGIDFNLPVPDVSPFSISGTVTSKQSGLPIEGAHLFFGSYNYFSNQFQTYTADTDAKGNYTVDGFTLLPEDSLIGFCYTDSNFFAQFYDGEATHLSADPIVYHANENVTGIDFALDTIDTQNAYAISGSVVDEDGNAVTTGEVTAYTTATNVGVITTMIDSSGHYAFDPVFPSGSTVYLQAWGGFGYIPQIYDNAETWKDATPIQVTDSDVTGIDFTLKKTAPARTPLATIIGHVKTTLLGKVNAASAYEGAVVYAKPAGTSEWTTSDNVDENGNFELPVQTNGEYDLMLSTRDQGDVNTTVQVENLESDVTLTPTGISTGHNNLVIKTSKLYEAYPNPFNPSTTIRVDMAKAGQASLTIYNVLGQKVKTLFNGNINQGSKKFVWNGTDTHGKQVASGLYFYQLKTKNTVQTKAVMFLK